MEWKEELCFELLKSHISGFISTLVPEIKPNASAEYLNTLGRRFELTNPFQNVTLLSFPNEKRHLPNEKELISQILSGRGGLCFDLNVFLKQILQYLELDVNFLAAYVTNNSNFKPGATKYFGQHTIVEVRNLAGKGSRHLMDVGFGHSGLPIFAIDFSTYSPVYTTPWGIDYRFRIDVEENGKKFLVRQQRNVPWVNPLTGTDNDRFIDQSTTDISQAVPVTFLADVVAR